MCTLSPEAKGTCIVNLLVELNLISESLGFWFSVMLLLLVELIFGNDILSAAVACLADRAGM